MKSEIQSAAAAPARASIVWDYLELTKPNVVWLILMSTIVAFYIGAPSQMPVLLLLHTAFATALPRWRTVLPEADVVELADVGHAPPEERGPESAALVGRFLDGTRRAA